MDKIQHEETETKGRFFIKNEQGEVLAEMTYSKAGPERIIIDHTEVSEALRGTGAGARLVEAGVQLARERQLKVLPLCPFARATFRKRTEWNDVL